MIKNESIEALLAAVDIVDVVERYVPLKRSGANFVGVCPFHDDSHPSMSVSSRLGIFHCFSCKAGGNAIKFIQDYEKLSFPEAVEKLASMYNFTLEYTSGKKEERKEDKRILQILNAYYQSCLYPNVAAMRYLRGRGLTDESIRKFGLGWAGASTRTIRVLQNEEIPAAEAIAAGAIKQNERGIYASFIDRITFPIYNHASKLVGFGGRTISGNPAKYVNSPQCALFDKSKIFYAFDLAKKSAYAKKTLIITEGYMDVIMLHQAGIDNAVAVLGTALTPSHLPLIKRSGLNVVLSFDGDEAGINAAIKSARLLSVNKIDSSVAIIGGDADPADMIVAGKARELEEIYASGMESGEFLIRQIAKKYDLSRPIQKETALNEIKAYARELDPVVAESYQSLTAEILGVSPSSFVLTGGGNFAGNKFKGGNFANEWNADPKSDFGKRNFTRGEQNLSSAANFTPHTAPHVRTKDIGELQILKSMLSSAGLFTRGKEVLEERDFRMHADLFALIERGENEQSSEALRALSLDEEILPLSEIKFFTACKILRRTTLQDMMQRVKNSDAPDKIERILEYQKKINQLK